MSNTDHPELSAGEILELVRSIAADLEEARKRVTDAEADALALCSAFDHHASLLPRHELAVVETVKALTRDFGIDVDGMRGDFHIEAIAEDARQLVELVEFAALTDDPVPIAA